MDSLYGPYRKEIQIQVVLFSVSVKMTFCYNQLNGDFFSLKLKQSSIPISELYNVFCPH